MGRPSANNDVVIFTRAPPALLVALRRRVKIEREQHPGRVVSQADVVREILWRELLAEKDAP